MTYAEWLDRFNACIRSAAARMDNPLRAAHVAGESPEDTAELALHFLSEDNEGLDDDDEDDEDEDEEDDDDDDEDDGDEDEEDDDERAVADFRRVWEDDD